MARDDVHVFPVDDLVEHDTDGGECVCGPRTEPVPREDGSIGWLIRHHSLDGREHHEAPVSSDTPTATLNAQASETTEEQ